MTFGFVEKYLFVNALLCNVSCTGKYKYYCNSTDLDLLRLYCVPYIYSTILVLYEQKKDLFSDIYTNILFHKWLLIPPVAQNSCFCYILVLLLLLFLLVLWIWIHWIRIRIQHFKSIRIRIPDPGFWWPKLKKIHLKIFFFFIKDCYLLIPSLKLLLRTSKLQKMHLALKRKHPALQKWNH